MPTILNADALKKQKQIFEETLVRELLAEIQFLWDVASKRAEIRKTYGQKVFGIISKALVSLLDLATAGSGIASLAVPPAVVITAGLGAVKTATDLMITGVEQVNANAENGNKKTSELLASAAGDFLEAALRQFAKVASLRYEYLIAVRLTDNPAGSVIPLARMGARRVVNYLKAQVENVNFKDKNFDEIQELDLDRSFPLSQFSEDEFSRLKTLIGKKINQIDLQVADYKNILFKEEDVELIKDELNKLNTTEAKTLSAKLLLSQEASSFPIIDFLLDGLIQGHSGVFVDRLFTNNYLVAKENSKEKLTVEGALGRPAMRELTPLSKDLVTNNWPIYHRMKPWHQEQGQDKRYSWGETSCYEKDKPESGPKYGYIFVNASTRQHYHYTDQFNDSIKNKPLLYTPTVYRASKEEVISYLKVMRQAKRENKPLDSFLSYVQRKKSPMRVDSVWVRAIDFKGSSSVLSKFSKDEFNRLKALIKVKANQINLPEDKHENISFEKEQVELITDILNEKSTDEAQTLCAKIMQDQNVVFDVGNFSEIDFAGCLFDGVKVGNVNFTRANLAFVSAKGWTCEGTVFNQADFSFADLMGSTFKGVQYIDATWTGTRLEDMKDTLLEDVNALKAKQEKQVSSIRKLREKLTKLNETINKIEKDLADQNKALSEQKTTLDQHDLMLKEHTEKMTQLASNTQALEKHVQFKLEEITVRIELLEKGQETFKAEYYQEIKALENRGKEVLAKLENIQAQAIAELEKFKSEVAKGNSYVIDVSLFENAEVSPGFKPVIKDFVSTVATVPSDLYKDSSPEEKLKYADKILNFVKEQKNAIRFEVGKNVKGGMSGAEITGVRTTLLDVGDSQKNKENTNNNNVSDRQPSESSQKEAESSLPMDERQYQLLQKTKEIFDNSKRFPKNSEREGVKRYRKPIAEKLERLEKEDKELSFEEEQWLLKVMMDNGDSTAVVPEATNPLTTATTLPASTTIPSMKDVVDQTLFASKQSSLPPVPNTPEGSKSLSHTPQPPGS